jgi:hypothetical protein
MTALAIRKISVRLFASPESTAARTDCGPRGRATRGAAVSSDQSSFTTLESTITVRLEAADETHPTSYRCSHWSARLIGFLPTSAYATPPAQATKQLSYVAADVAGAQRTDHWRPTGPVAHWMTRIVTPAQTCCVANTFLGMVSGRSTALRSPGAALTT